MNKRLEYIEDENLRHVQEVDKKADDVVIKYPVLARYDFVGKGPRPGNVKDEVLFSQAALLQTKGEKLKPLIIRMAWIFIRLAIGLAFTYFFIYGNTFTCDGRQILMN